MTILPFRLLLPALAIASPAGGLRAQVPTAPPTAPYPVADPDRTRYFPVQNDLLGAALPTRLPAAQGIDWRRFMSGAAYAMQFTPSGGPDCDPTRDDARIEFWTLDADTTSRLAINLGARLGALFVTGTVRRYVQANDFCTSKAFTESGTGRPGYLYVPFAPMGWSPRNFIAAGLTLQREDDRISSATVGAGSALAGRVPGRFTAPELDLRLVGYASPDMLGTSQALSEGPGGAVAADMIRRHASEGVAAETLRNMPGVVPGERGEGYFELMLADRPMQEITGRNAAFAYVHVRIVHDARELTPGAAYTAAMEAIRATGDVVYDPATPNDPRRRRP